MGACLRARHLNSGQLSFCSDGIPLDRRGPRASRARPGASYPSGGKMGPGKWRRRRPAVIAAAAVAAGTLALAACGIGSSGTASLSAAESPVRTTTPIKHVVVLFDENISFDHYFGTYPKAANTDGTKFTAKKHTPKVDGLTKKLLTKNPNQYNPTRLTHEQALTCDQ